MNKMINYVIIILLSLSCSDVNINTNGVDDSEILTGSEYYSLIVTSYSIKYLSCGINQNDALRNDPLFFMYFFIPPIPQTHTSGPGSADPKDFSFGSKSVTFYYYKKDVEYCTESILAVPCQAELNDLAKSLQFSVLKNCENNKAMFKKSGDGNW